jgi:formylglycine-generating enzyme required for sulfatase activity/tRNA A-37 threonylcarbamoyl transferase component Bud32/dienelactone hydrolase
MIGRTLSHYKIQDKLGEGGMGVLYRALDTHLGRTVAIKVLRPEAVGSPERKRRFVLEAKAASALNHPNIITIYDIDKTPLDGEEIDFIAMEYVEGKSLDALVTDQGLPMEKALDCTVQMASALAAAHKAGIVHRDVKPANIMVTEEGQVKVLDFGLAKLVERGEVDESATTLTAGLHTEEGAILGTAAYMSPEQAEGKPVDACSDVFSFGTVFYEMLSGKRPFQGDSHVSMRMAVLHDEPPPLKSVGTEVPLELERILARCLEKKAVDRYPGAGELLNDLSTLRSSLAASKVGLKAVLRRPRVAVPALLVLVTAVAIGVLYWRQAWRVRSARETALPEVERLAEEGDFVSAFRLAEQVEPILPEDPELHRLMQVISHPFNVETEPAGAGVYYKDYGAPDDDWELLGISPIESERLPFAYLRFKVVKEGFMTAERVAPSAVRSMRLKLDPEGAQSPTMVHVSGGAYKLGNLDPVQLEDYWLDKYEVTNRDFKQFVEAGGYRSQEYWREPFFKDGENLSLKEAMDEFTDRTGRPGPATWELGSYPEGEEDHPVGGVSWYEAAAYCEFLGKGLPTIYHWRRASGSAWAKEILTLSNFGRQAPAKVGSSQGLSLFGTYDMAGNVKEWCWNERSGQRYILGGAWNEPPYMFVASEHRDPMERSATHGFRCARFDEPLPASVTDATGPVDSFIYDYGNEEPVGDDVYEVYKSFYTYDRTELNANVESVDTSSPYWRRERITFDAAYGEERVIIYMFLPSGTSPPYQVVIYFPGAEGLYLKSFDDIPTMFFDFIVRGGRALVYPVYKGMLERGPRVGFDKPSALRDQITQQYKDLARSVDYLETREDIEHEKLAYAGFSIGAAYGPLMTALEKRFKASVLFSGGFMRAAAPEVQSLHFTPRSATPTLMLNGRDDFGYPLDTSQIPMFRLLGAPEKDKRHIVLDSGHIPSRIDMIRETLDWLDRYLGPVEAGR